MENSEALTLQTELHQDGPHDQKTSSPKGDQLYPKQQELSTPRTYETTLLTSHSTNTKEQDTPELFYTPTYISCSEADHRKQDDAQLSFRNLGADCCQNRHDGP